MNETELLASVPASPRATLAQHSQEARLLRLHTPLGPDRLLPEQLSGQESLSEGGFRFEVTALSTDAHLDLNTLLGQPVLIELLTQQSRSQLRPIHGHVTRFALLGSEGGFARYRLTIEPWLAFLRYRQDSYVFQDQSVIQIVEEIFGDYTGQGKLDPAWRCELADPGVYPKRSLCIQYEESDFAFVERLLAEEGLFYWFEHQGDPEQSPFGHHTLVIADHNGAFKPNAQANIQFLRADATEAEDTIQRWHGARKLQTNRIELASWDYRRVSARPVSASRTEGAQALDLSAADHPGPYAYNDSADGERYAALHLQALAARGKTYSAEGTVRTLAPGTTFTLAGHAEHDRDRQAQGDEAARFAVLSVEHQAKNNLSSALRTGIEPLLGSAFVAPEGSPAPLYRNRFQAIRSDIAYRPLGEDDHGLRIHPKPTAPGTQTAIVVGVDGAPLTTERDHRIKIQFHWQRGAKGHHRQAHPSESDNAPANETSGTWVRVATPLAGANWGGVFIPRIGQEVLVAFMEGDIDRPVIIGTLYNGRGQDNAQANQVNAGAGSANANAPAWFAGSGGAHAHNAVLCGIKTQELPTSQSGAGGYNQLVFDDTPGQSRTTLSSTQASTQLNLGHLKHQSDNTRKADRGHGAELVTSAYGAIRAGSGLLISTDVRANASSTQLDSREAQAQLTQAQQLAQTLTTTAQQHQAKLPGEPEAQSVPAVEQLSHSLEVLQSTAGAAATESADSHSIGGGQGQVPAWSEPMMVLSSPAGIAALTPADAVLAGGNTLSLSAQDINLMAQANSVTAVKAGIGLFTYGKAQSSGKPNQETGLKLHAASGEVSLQAHSDALKATADKTVTITSTNQSIQVGAHEHVLLTAGGAYVRLAGGNIEIHAPGAVSFKASQKNWTGPQSASVGELRLPNGAFELPQIAPVLRSLQWQLHSGLDGELQSNVPYQIVSDGKVVAQGNTDSSGQTQRHVDESFYQPFEVWFGESGWSVQPDPDDALTPVPLDDQIYDDDDLLEV